MTLVRNKLAKALVGGALVAAGMATAAPALAATPATITYDEDGSSRIGGQVNQTIQIGPSKFTGTVDLDTGAISNGTLPLPSKIVTFPVLGGLATLRATVSLVQSGKITGQLGDDGNGNGTATANAKYTIKLTNAQFKTPITPYAPIFVGNNCQTASPANINLKNPPGTNFDASLGGTLTGTYTIGQFTGCNALFIPGVGTVLVNALVPNPNNTISITLKNGQLTFPN